MNSARLSFLLDALLVLFSVVALTPWLKVTIILLTKVLA